MYRFPFFTCFLALAMPLWSQAQLAESQFEQAGTHQTELVVQEPGRYSIAAESDRGIQITLYDRMAGPIKSDGIPGSRDGRIDILLDRGTYKIRTRGPDDVSGTFSLSVEPFQELNDPDSALVPLELVSTNLADRQQRSYQVVLTQQTELRLEIMGRALIDARLWLPGGWLADVQPTVTTYEAESGKPMTHIEYHHTMPAGQYLLTCYGGEAKTWANEDDSTPLHLRLGVRQAGIDGYFELTVSPFGREAFLIHGAANFVELRRADKKPTRLIRAAYQAGASRYLRNWYQREIDKNSREPYILLDGRPGGTPQWLVVEAAPGDVVTVQHFTRDNLFIPTGKRLFVGTQVPFAQHDMLETSGILSYRGNALYKQLAQLSPESPYARRTNLLKPLAVMLEITEPGEYVLETTSDDTAQATHRLRPIFESPPEDFRPPAYQSAGYVWDLLPGYYALDLNPVRAGIYSFSLHAVGKGLGVVTPPHMLGHALNWPNVDTRELRDTPVLLTEDNNQWGLIIRELPLNLDEPLPLCLPPNGQTTLEIQLAETRRLMIEGDPSTLTIAGRTLASGDLLQPGNYQLKVYNAGSATGYFQLYTAPDRSGPLFDPDWNDLISRLPKLSADQPYYTDLQRLGSAFFHLRVEEPGLYRVETSGRMATALHLRGRTDANLFSGDQNGVGRNGLIQQYLRNGDYLVTVAAKGNSQGRLGIHLKQTPIQEGAPLENDKVARVRLDADGAVQYPLSIEEPGTYKLTHLGLGKQFALRLEDSDGYPLEPIRRQTYLQRDLEEGEYALYSLPEPVESRRLTKLEKVEEPKPPTGKGPHPISLNQELTMTWTGGEPDRYQLEMPAPATCTVSLTKGMQARFEGPGKPITIVGGEAWKGRLDGGTWRIEVTRLEEDNLYPYSLRIGSKTLMAGVSQPIGQSTQHIELSLSRDELVDIRSFGSMDVKARLLNEQGQELARNDDGVNDWNFHIARRLTAGTYTLDISTHGHSSNDALVSLVPRPEKAFSQQTLPFDERTESGETVHAIPFITTAAGLFHCEAAPHIALALLREGHTLAEGNGELAIPLLENTSYRLLAWNPDGGGGALVTARMLSTETVSLNKPTRLRGKGPWLLENSVGLVWRADRNDLRFAARAEQPLKPVPDGILNLAAGQGWLVGNASRLSPVTLTEGTPLQLVQGELPHLVEVTYTGDGPALISSEGVGRQAAIELYHPGQATGKPYRWSYQTQLVNKTQAIIPTGGTWQAQFRSPEEGHPVGDMRITLKSYPLTETSNEIPPGKAVSREVPGGTWTSLALTGGLVAAHLLDGAVLGVYSAGETSAEWQLREKGGNLIILNTGTDVAAWDLSPRYEHNVLESGTEIEMLAKPGHTYRVQMPEADTPLQLAGALKVIWKGDDGYRLDHEGYGTLDVGAGWLEITTTGGFIKIWRGETSKCQQDLLGALPANEGSLSPHRALTGPTSFTFDNPDEEQLLFLKTNVPGILTLLQGEEVIEQQLGNTPELVRLITPGTYTVAYRPIAGQRVDGALSYQTIQPQTFSGEQAPWNLIREGTPQAWFFEVAQKGRVGVGLQTNNERLDAQLFDAHHQKVGSGPYLYRELTEGRYLLVVHGQGPPTRYRPLLYGAKGPGSIIPSDILQKFKP